MRRVEKYDYAYSSRLSSEDVLGTYDAFESILSREGIDIHATSRLAQYQHAVAVARQVARRECPPSLFNERLVLQAFHECDEIASSTVTLACANVHGWQELVRAVLVDPALPETDHRSSQGRDRQLELFCAALLVKVGCEVRIGEPDVEITLNGRKIGLAAKRPRSSARLAKTLRKAEKQIVATHNDGIVVLDVSLLRNPQWKLFRAKTPAQGVLHATSEVDSFLATNKEVLARAFKTDRVCGVLTFCTVLGYYEEPECLGSARRLGVVNTCALEDERIHWLGALTKSIAGVMASSL